MTFLLSWTDDCEQYADDTTLSASYFTAEETSSILNNNCEKITNWMSENQLKLNPDKTHMMTVGTSQRIKLQENQLNIIKDQITLK